MDQLQKHIADLNATLDEAAEQLKLAEMQDRLKVLTDESAAPEFWADNIQAGEKMKEQAALKQRVEPWQLLLTDAQELKDLAALGDANLRDELEQQLNSINERFSSLKKELRYNQPHDQDSAILSIYAGAGGTDAQDWAQMLLRMYLRWAESHNYSFTTVAESAGEEAGIKSVTVEVSGSLAFGRLKGEHGVHRLVRLSPFNADSLRQTSFAKVEVLPKIERPEEIDIDPKDLKIDVYRAGGHGGQSVNTTDSAVRITHVPTGITVAIQNERSQLQNRETAMTIVRSKLAQLQLEQHTDKLSELKGPNQSAEWGNQIRNYVLHPYKLVKDLRSNHETSDTEAVLNGEIDGFIEAYTDSVLAA